MPDDETQHATRTFESIYGSPPACCAFAPGRVELLGNHTDYNGGYVLSVALELGITVCAAPLPDGQRRIELWSEAFDEKVSFPLDALSKVEGSWANYPLGVILELVRADAPIQGTRMAISSNLPVGAGVSSSAALELATAEAMYELYGGRPRDRMEEAKLCQRAEVSFVGMPCGLLDQFSSAFGKPNCFLFLDCDSLDYAQIEATDSELRVVVADSGVSHALVDGQYAALRAACERSARRLGKLLDHPVRFLRDVTTEEFASLYDELPSEDRPRAEHVVNENRRVLDGIDAIRSGDFTNLGKLMVASHESSRDLFGNSTPELDFLVRAATELPGCIGAKLTGAGLGGSTVNLVAAGHEEVFATSLRAAYFKRFNRRLRTLVTGIGGGARVQ